MKPGSEMKQKTYKEKETLQERGTKRYQERLVEQKEAEQMIKEYKQEKDDYIDSNNIISSIDWMY